MNEEKEFDKEKVNSLNQTKNFDTPKSGGFGPSDDDEDENEIPGAGPRGNKDGDDEKGYSPQDDDEKDYQLDKAKNKNKGAKSKTPILDHFGRDLTAKAANDEFDPVVGRDKEIDQLVRILNKRKKNNAVLIGDPGIGKTAVVEGLAQKIANKEVDPSLLNVRIIELSLTALVAGTKFRGQFEERMDAIIKEATENPDIIMFIDELHNIMGAGASSGAMDASNILKPALARGEIKVIGATTYEEYQKYIESDKALERRFQPVKVPHPKREEVMEILQNIKSRYEEHHGVSYSTDVLIKIIDWSERYIPAKNNPDKAIDLLDEVGSNIKINNTPPIPDEIRERELQLDEIAAQKKIAADAQNFEEAATLKDKEKQMIVELEEMKAKFEEELKKSDNIEVTLEDVALIVSHSTGIPMNNLTEEEVSRLLKMPDELQGKIIDQDDAVKRVSEAIQRSRTGVRDPKKPIGSFLFLGSTGVGKTELCKQLSMFLFGTEDNIIRLDMSEYSMKHEAAKLIGSPPGFVGHDEGGQLTEQVKQKPYSIILFDEIEKAHEDLKNYLLQILDEGRLTDAKGRSVDFKNTIIIMTSNIGTQKIVQNDPIGFAGKKELDQEQIEYAVLSELEKHRLTTPEFINRIDDVIVFKTLSEEGIKKIVNIQLDILKKRMKNDREIEIEVTDAVVDLLADKGYDHRYGARPLKRMISKYVENALSVAIMKKEVTDGNKVIIDYKKDEVVIKNVSKK